MVGRWERKERRMSAAKQDIPGWVKVRGINVKYLGATDHKGTRLTAHDMGGWGKRVTVSWDYRLNGPANWERAASVVAGEGWEPIGVVDVRDGESLHVFLRRGL
jgi:hypothetical protein